MKAIQLVEAEQIRLVDVERPTGGADDVLVSVKACGLCTTDIEILEGRFWGDYPVVPGHEIAGIVKKIGGDVQSVAVGDRVSVDPNIPCGNCPPCLGRSPHLCSDLQAIGVTRPGGFAELVSVPAANVYRLPDSVSMLKGALAEPLACVLHGIERAKPQWDEPIAIYGAGFIGLLFSLVLRHKGFPNLTLIEPVQPRREFARQLGFKNAVSPVNIAERNATGDARRSPSLSIDCTGNAAAIQSAMESTRAGGRVLLFGVADPDVRVPMSPYDVFRRELSILGSFVNPHTQSQAVELLGDVELQSLISHRFSLDQFGEAVDVRKQCPEARKIMIEPTRGSAAES